MELRPVQIILGVFIFFVSQAIAGPEKLLDVHKSFSGHNFQDENPIGRQEDQYRNKDSVSEPIYFDSSQDIGTVGTEIHKTHGIQFRPQEILFGHNRGVGGQEGFHNFGQENGFGRNGGFPGGRRGIYFDNGPYGNGRRGGFCESDVFHEEGGIHGDGDGESKSREGFNGKGAETEQEGGFGISKESGKPQREEYDGETNLGSGIGGTGFENEVPDNERPSFGHENTGNRRWLNPPGVFYGVENGGRNSNGEDWRFLRRMPGQIRPKRSSSPSEENFYNVWRFDSTYRNVDGQEEEVFRGFVANDEVPEGRYYYGRREN